MGACKQLRLPSASLLLKITWLFCGLGLTSPVYGSRGYRSRSLAGIVELITSPNCFEKKKIAVGFVIEMTSSHKVLIGVKKVKCKVSSHIQILSGEPVTHFVLVKIGFCAVLGQTELNACLLQGNLFSDCKN